MTLEVCDDSLIHWLYQQRRVWRHKHQLHVGQLYDIAVSSAVVAQHDDLPFLFSHLDENLFQPFSPEVTGHPGVFVGFVVHWKTLDILKAARVLALSNRQRLQLLSAAHVAG